MQKSSERSGADQAHAGRRFAPDATVISEIRHQRHRPREPDLLIAQQRFQRRVVLLEVLAAAGKLEGRAAGEADLFAALLEAVERRLDVVAAEQDVVAHVGIDLIGGEVAQAAGGECLPARDQAAEDEVRQRQRQIDGLGAEGGCAGEI